MERSGVLSFSTDDIPARDRVPLWREEFARGVVRMDVEPLGEDAFRSVSEIRLFPDLKMWSCFVTAAEVRRTRSLAANGDDSLVLAIIRSGRTVVSQKGKDIALSQGSAVLWSSEAAGVFHNPGLMDIVTLAFPRTILKRIVTDIDKVLLRTIPASTEALRLLCRYTDMLRNDPAVMESALGGVASSHVQDLAALALGATRDGADRAGRGGLRAARLDAIKSDIMSDISAPDLNVRSIAARHGISPRYIRALFETEDTSFTDFVREQRLMKAYRSLGSVAFAGRSISTIAFDCGFGDLSYFNHSFRRRFGATPSDIRGQTPAIGESGTAGVGNGRDAPDQARPGRRPRV